MDKIIYNFGGQDTVGDSSMSDILGGKGANLAQMCKIGLPIPPGFTISTKLCQESKGEDLQQDFINDLDKAIKELEEKTEKKFGKEGKVLLLSVRSGAKVSMPGMMDTILNLGMNDEVAARLAQQTENPCFAYDSYRRFLEMYGAVVLGVSGYLFEEILDTHKEQNNISKDSDFSEEDLKSIITDFKKVIKKYSGNDFEENPFEQLKEAIKAVLKSWNSPRAITYRAINNIRDDIGTAVNVQSMVFGNMGETSATGVIFTRNPSTGENKIFGEYLINAQGEDVVAGVRTPSPILSSSGVEDDSMQNKLPNSYKDLVDVCTRLESHYKDMQDIEFTIEEGKLYILQTRSGKRTAAAALKIATDLENDGIIDRKEALMRIEPESLNQLLHTAIDYSNKVEVISKGLPASPGAATARVVFSPYDAEEMSSTHKVILVRNDTSPEDIKGMHVSEGIITARGGMTSHAAVVARGMGKPCVCGVKGLVVNEKQKFFTTSSGVKVKQGDIVTIDGSNGNIIIGDVKLIQPEFSEEFKTILDWSDNERDLKVRANAETELDASVAIKFGAVGIGLCRTEHMFFDENKIPLVREMIIADNNQQRELAIKKLKPLQTEDFVKLFGMMKDRPVNVRLLDPPLHEFLPTEEKDKQDLAKSLNVSVDLIDHRLHALHELNPMLGHRGCRLGISFPEIYIMQVEAMLDAIASVQKSQNIKCNLEIMIPLISEVKELELVKSYIDNAVLERSKSNNTEYNIKIGTMIELPRSAITADEIANHVEYFSFGSNDLTQTTYGISRDDIGSFLPDYLEKKIFNHDPFTTIDTKGVGALIDMAISKGKRINNALTFGICGEHAGDPESIDFFQKAGLDYISCSPYRLPIARVAAARSKIKQERGEL